MKIGIMNQMINFTDYCIATRNYSALSAIREYTKSFTSIITPLLRHGGTVGATIASGMLGGLGTYVIIDKINQKRIKEGKKPIKDSNAGLMMLGGVGVGASVPHVAKFIHDEYKKSHPRPEPKFDPDGEIKQIIEDWKNNKVVSDNENNDDIA